MSTRAGWTLNGKHFRETRDINGHTVYFLDGRRIAKAKWLAEYKIAKKAETLKTKES